MYKRAFQAMKRTFMIVIGLPTLYFDSKKQNTFQIGLFIKS